MSHAERRIICSAGRFSPSVCVRVCGLVRTHTHTHKRDPQHSLLKNKDTLSMFPLFDGSLESIFFIDITQEVYLYSWEMEMQSSHTQRKHQNL